MQVSACTSFSIAISTEGMPIAVSPRHGKLDQNENSPVSSTGEFSNVIRSIIAAANVDHAVGGHPPAAVTMGVVVVAVMMVAVVVMAMVVVAVMVVAVVMMAMVMAAMPVAVAVPTGKRRAIDRQRGSAQSENCNRRNNELPDLGHSHSPDLCSASIACHDRERRRPQLHAM
ncbi:hypothetical protein [Bradyrhizobium sp. OAE829]|uniref:hypothetical protein n=1 Tax=Bradyrhizobium sp. OAE829 TaxID=2663807 RepID=UPI00178BC6CE